MALEIKITNEDILKQVKLSLKLPDIIEQITINKIIANTLAELNITIDKEFLQTVADKYRLMNRLETVDQTYKWMEENQLSLEEFEELIYNSAMSSKLGVELVQDKIEPYFYENQLDYAGAIIYEIIVDDSDLALELFYMVEQKEASFWDLAHEYIQDKELRRKGGYLGLVKRENLKPEISSKVFSANPPQVLKPITTSKGFHVIFVEEIIKPELNNLLRNYIANKLFSDSYYVKFN